MLPFLILLSALFTTSSSALPISIRAPAAAVNESAIPHLSTFEDTALHFEALRSLSPAVSLAGDIGEWFETIDLLKTYHNGTPTPVDWFNEWSRLGDQAGQDAVRAEKSRIPRLIQWAHGRASSYHRESEFYLRANWTDPRATDAHNKHVAHFDKYVAAGRYDTTQFTIPYAGKYDNKTGKLPGYFYKAPGPGKKPVHLLINGFDGTQQEAFFAYGPAAIDAGYHFVTVEGPGHLTPLRTQNLTYQPDWESVVGPAVDYLLKRPDVDPKRIALHGVSLGGMFAARAAAFEKRLSAVILDDGVTHFPYEDQLKAVKASKNIDVLAMSDKQDWAKNPAAVEAFTDKLPYAMRWGMLQATYTFRERNQTRLIERTRQFDARPFLSNITMPALVFSAENDIFFAGQPPLVFKGLVNSPKKKFIDMTWKDGLSAHSSVGATFRANLEMYEWLNDVWR